jgi:pilus assembly protein FimV
LHLGDALKQPSPRAGRAASRWPLNAVAAATLAIAACLPLDAAALALGRLSVQSALGEALKAEVDVGAITPEEASTLRVRVAAPEAFRAAGVEYNPALGTATVTLQRRPDGKAYLRLTSDRPVQEPFVDVILELNWSAGRLVREFTMLFDPPVDRAVAAAPAPAPAPAVISPAPRPAAPRPGTIAISPPARAAASAVTPPKPDATPSPSAATAGATATIDEYRVKRGDTLYKIASRTMRPGVSLDQMLVSLYRGNTDAFIDDNMNRLKAGALLSVPTAEQAQSTDVDTARQLIQAQAADFDAYRQKLAGGVPTAPTAQSGRAAAGRVQAEVQDSKADAAATPDKLTLSQGGVMPGKPAAEDRLAKSRAAQDEATRVAELSKNVEELQKLRGATAGSGSAATGSQTKPGGVELPVAPPGLPAAATSASAPGTAASVSAPGVALAPASTQSEAASAAAGPAATASEVASPSDSLAQAPDTAPVPSAPSQDAAASAAASAPVLAPVPADPGPGFVDELLDNPMLLPGAAVLLALLAGFGLYRLRQGKRDSGETSFLESRLQPDSFFGASGGQRVDTRDATGVPSSMSYSLSQLDAIGDVDPVAEADVYLAYGRDLQAEEILKEAMRSNPERMAIRLKLLEVYAKRRDTKGFEQLATQLYAMTGGEGEDWARAQEIGRGIDSDNPVYQPGGRPVGAAPLGGAMVEPLGASTMPQSVLPSPSRYEAQRTDLPEDSEVDLDLDVSVPGQFDDAPSFPPERTQPLPAMAHAPSASSDAGTASAKVVEDLNEMTFDLPALTLDMPSQPAPLAAEAGEAHDNLATLELPGVATSDDALARKLELAEEFRQIGDVEGARDLLEEVIAQSGGTLKTRAEGMLRDLA